MEHNRKQFKPILNLALAGALSLVLAACDNSTEPEGAAEASSTAEAYTGPDYSQVVSGGEVKGAIVFGDITVGNPEAPITMIEYEGGAWIHDTGGISWRSRAAVDIAMLSLTWPAAFLDRAVTPGGQ